ncbi:MAG: histidine kinase [Chloroflexota bacterium]
MRIDLRDPGWVATIAAGSLALGLAAAMFVLRFTSQSELAVIPTESWPWASQSVGVEGVGDATQFRAGDRVGAIDGMPMSAWVDWAVGPPWDAPPAALGDVVRFDVLRAGSPLALEVPLVRFPFERLGGAPLSLVTFGAGVLVLALVLMLRRSRTTALRLLFVGAAANVADITAWGMGLQPTDFARPGPTLAVFGIASLFNIVFWSTIVHILAIYPIRSPLAVRRPLLIPALYVVPLVVFFVLVALAWLAGGTSLDRVDRLAACMAMVGSGMLVAVIASTIAGYRRTAGLRRRQVRWIAAALLFAAGATLGLLTLPIVLTGAPLVPRSTVSFLVLPVPIAIAVAVIRDRLFQVGLLSRSREQIVAVREEERRKLRRELHDGLAPTLAGAGIKLDLARQGVRDDPGSAETLIDEARADVRAAISDIRRLARDLRPPTLDALGLEGALREQAAGLASPSGDGPVIIVDVPKPLPVLPAAVEVAAYRIAVEALLNVVRHASAERCEVRLALGDDELEVDVVDDGRGLSSGTSGVGTRAMRERAAEVGGEVRIEMSASGGTRVAARLPVDLSPRRAGA